jgi:hypothetical protein
MKFMKKNSQAGITLIQVVMGMAIFFVVIRVSMTIVGGNKDLDPRVREKVTIGDIKQLVTSRVDCTATRNAMPGNCIGKLINVFKKTTSGPTMLIKSYRGGDHTLMFDEPYRYRVRAKCTEYGYFNVEVSKNLKDGNTIDERKRKWININSVPITCI